MYTLTYYDEFGDRCTANFHNNEYHSLMELLFDKYMEEWGDCRGRAWCGTCHIQIIEGEISGMLDEAERKTLSKLDGTNAQSRLACQIPVNAQLNNIVFKVMSDNDYG